MRTHGPRLAALAGAGTGLVVLFVVVTRHPGVDPWTRRAVDDLGLLLGAGTAAAACGWRAHRAGGRAGVSWGLLSAGTACWGLGEAIWSYYELVADRETPFPSAADAGFLLFPVLAAFALLLWPSQALQGGARWRTLLDGVLVAGALFALSWESALGAVVGTGGDDLLGYVVSIAYPVSDLVLLTLTVVVAAHARRAAAGLGLGLLAAGLCALAVADSGFAYLTAQGTFESGSPVDAGWLAGFLLIALAALATTVDPVGQDAAPAPEATARLLLPYVPAGLGLALALEVALSGRRSIAVLGAATVVIAALFLRQLLAVLDNRGLVRRLLAAQEQLRHQAFHDPLTGLANRALFTDRLRHGLALHARDLRPLSLLYCDLDGFKAVNDQLGHDAGDEVLRAAAERLRAVTRGGDTVARMGGDEFAILLEDGGDALNVALKILAALAQPTTVGRHVVDLGVSIGIAELDPGAPSVTPVLLLQRADAAMYEAKRGGKGRVATWTPDATTVPA
jgi:diguanylate cyclase (GGDEF)-like protein